MILLLDSSAIFAQLLRQLQSFFPINDEDMSSLEAHFDEALDRSERCFSHIRNKYFSRNGETSFNPSHGGQWSIFLYYLANSIFHDATCAGGVSEKLYALNKVMSGADLFYQVELPNVFFFDHPVGSVIGRGMFSDYFTFSQGCTVGNNHGIYPCFEESVFMMSDSKVIGNCHIGHHVIIGANTYIKDTDIPSGSLVFGSSPNLIIKQDCFDAIRDHANAVFSYE